MATQEDVDALRSAAARGIVSVRFADGRQVTYAGPREMLEAASHMQALVVDPARSARTTLSSFDRSA